MNSKVSLAKGLDAILKTQSADTSSDIKHEIIYLSINSLIPSKRQPRSVFSEERLAELAQSIKHQGVIQPIVVRKGEDDKFEIICGERRCRAAKIVGLEKVPAIIKDVEDRVASAFSLVENIQRQDLNIIEEARALNRLLTDFSMTHEEVSQIIGRSRASVTNILRLLDAVESIKQYLFEKKIEMGHARALLALGEAEQKKAVEIVVEKKLSVRETENLVKRILYPKPTENINIEIYDHLAKDFGNRLSNNLMSKVDIKLTARGKAKVALLFESVEELERFVKKIELTT